jgi:hypothetical protein
MSREEQLQTKQRKGGSAEKKKEISGKKKARK